MLFQHLAWVTSDVNPLLLADGVICSHLSTSVVDYLIWYLGIFWLEDSVILADSRENKLL